jgi:hypothetical protein
MTLDDYLGWMEEYERDYEYFQANYRNLYTKYKNEFVAVKNLKVYHDVNPLRLQEQLREDGVIDVAHTLIEIMGDISKCIS